MKPAPQLIPVPTGAEADVATWSDDIWKPDSSRGNMFDRLPVEVQARIIRHLDPAIYEDRIALVQCLMVFRSLRSIILAHLFRRFNIRRLFGPGVHTDDRRMIPISSLKYCRHLCIPRDIHGPCKNEMTVEDFPSEQVALMTVVVTNIISACSDGWWHIDDDIRCDACIEGLRHCIAVHAINDMAPPVLVLQTNGLGLHNFRPLRTVFRNARSPGTPQTIIIRPDCWSWAGGGAFGKIWPRSMERLILLLEPELLRKVGWRGSQHNDFKTVASLILWLLDTLHSSQDPVICKVTVVGLGNQIQYRSDELYIDRQSQSPISQMLSDLANSNDFGSSSDKAEREKSKRKAGDVGEEECQNFQQEMDDLIREEGSKDHAWLNTADRSPDNLVKVEKDLLSRLEWMDLKDYAKTLQGVQRDILTDAMWDYVMKSEEDG